MDNGSQEKKKKTMLQPQQMLLPVVYALLWNNDKRSHQQTANCKPLQQSISMSSKSFKIDFHKEQNKEQNRIVRNLIK